MTIVVYSKDNCPQCLQVENLLKMKGKTYEIKKLDKDYTREDLEKMFEAAGKPVARSFPMVFVGNEFVGTLNEVKMAIVKGIL